MRHPRSMEREERLQARAQGTRWRGACAQLGKDESVAVMPTAGALGGASPEPNELSQRHRAGMPYLGGASPRLNEKRWKLNQCYTERRCPRESPHIGAWFRSSVASKRTELSHTVSAPAPQVELHGSVGTPVCHCRLSHPPRHWLTVAESHAGSTTVSLRQYVRPFLLQLQRVWVSHGSPSQGPRRSRGVSTVPGAHHRCLPRRP